MEMVLLPGFWPFLVGLDCLIYVRSILGTQEKYVLTQPRVHYVKIYKVCSMNHSTWYKILWESNIYIISHAFIFMVRRWMVFGKIICMIIFTAGAQYTCKSFLVFSQSQWNLTSQLLFLFLFTKFLTNPNTVKWSVLIGVGGWG